MTFVDRYKYSSMPDLRASTPELRGEARQMLLNLKSSTRTIIWNATQLALVNSAALWLINYGVLGLDPHCLPLVHWLAPYIGAAYSLKLLKTLLWMAIVMYPAGVAYDAARGELAERRRKVVPEMMDDIR